MMKSIPRVLRFAARWLVPPVLCAAIVTVGPSAPDAAVDSTCLTSPSGTTYSGTTLDGIAEVKSGAYYEPNAGGALQLNLQGGQFQDADFSVTDPIEVTCAGDFDEDGWTDFVGGTGNTSASSGLSMIKFYRNDTKDNPAPTKWTNASIDCTNSANLPPTDNFVKCVRKPKFTATKLATGKHIEEGTSSVQIKNVGGSIVCADFNKDTHMDIMYLRCTGTTENCDSPRADMFLGMGPINKNSSTASDRLPRFQAKYQFVSAANLSKLGNVRGPSDRVGVFDKNGDGYPDIVVGLSTSSGSTAKGKLVLAINSGTASPTFNTISTLITDVSVGENGFTAVAVGKVTQGDNIYDILAGGEDYNRAILYTDLLGGGATTSQVLYAPNATAGTNDGALAMTLLADFSMDGLIDGFGGADNETGNSGGNSYIWTNTGTATPFSGTPQRPTVHSTSLPDFDGGFFMDYDHDPDSTPDAVVMDDDSGNYRVIANLVQDTFAPCGTIDSAIIPIGAIGSSEASVTTVKITPTVVIPTGTSISWQASNDGGANWTNATLCPSSTTSYCATFSTTVGTEVKWRALLFSNSSASCSAAAGLATPKVTSVKTEFTYVTASNQFRAGPVTKDGIIYVGASRQPTGAGSFFAIDDETLDSNNARSWNAATKLEAMTDGSRNLYTATSTNVKVPFDDATAVASTTAGTNLRTALSAGTTAAASAVVGWVRSSRFGLATNQRFGAVENSSAAVLSVPTRPDWYTSTTMTAADKTLVDNLITAQANRQELVFVGSRDGMLHAFYTDHDDSSDTKNGTEAWAFVPYDVTRRLITDCINSSTATTPACAASNKAGSVTAYPDGSPTLIDVKIGSAYKTVLVMGEGNGGNAVFALDVTSTIDSSGTVVGPTPLWSWTDTNMGRTYSKPTVIRVNDNGAGEKFLAVFASGPVGTSNIGDSVYALDVATGAKVWEFNLGTTDSYISTAIAAFETNDTAETGSPTKDGYVDRIVFADSKGRVFKLNPGVHTSTTITSIGSVNAGLGTGKNALFSTATTSGALGVARAIGGSIGVAEDSTGRVVLYFGTGGTDDTATGLQNAFYAVYADTGAIRNKVTPAVGVKFFGGVSVLESQVVFSTANDSSGTGLCTASTGDIQVRDLNTLALQFQLTTTSKIMAPMYTNGSQVYTVTAAGEVVTSAYTPVSGQSSGSGSGSGAGSSPPAGSGTGVELESTKKLTVAGWKQVEL